MAKIVSKIGEMVPMDWTRWFDNLVKYTLPLFSGTLFAQLALGVEPKKAFTVSLLTLYGGIADFINKRQTETVYGSK